MRRMERRALICLTLAAILFIGLGVFVYRFVVHGNEWATFYGNQNLYSGEGLTSGAVFDRYGTLLVENTDDGPIYNDDYYIRLGTIHTVGDSRGNVSTAVLSAYRDKLIGYNLITGTYKMTGTNEDIKLTLDADACSVAYQWLSDYEAGTVGVYNYKTGEILCMVSNPGFDPYYPPELEEGNTSGIYMNRFLSATLTPGSIFKTVTAAAAIDNFGADGFSYYCEGEREVDGEYITCMEAHGELDLEDALAVSCNCAFSVLAESLGEEVLGEYVEMLGLTKAYNMDGIQNVPGSFSFPDDAPINLGWAGCGQYQDELNPCSMMIYMGAIANGGKAAVPYLLEASFIKETINSALKQDTGQLLNATTADKLANMMIYNVESVYGDYNFPGLSIGAKTGTGEVEGKESNATFAGFLLDPSHPYAFVVTVENAGSGLEVAAPIANAVLQELVSK